MQIPDGQAWLCWQGCPQGLSAANGSADVIHHPPHDAPTSWSRSGAVTSVAAALRGRALTADQAEQVTRGERGPAERTAREFAAGAAVPAVQGPATVHVAGVALDLIPIWLRFGHIITLADLSQRATRRGATADGWRGPTAEASGQRDEPQDPGQRHADEKHAGDEATRRQKLERSLTVEGGQLQSVLATGQGFSGDRASGQPRRRVGGDYRHEPAAAAAGGRAGGANESAIDFGGVLTAEAALQQPRWAAVLLAAVDIARGTEAGAPTGVWCALCVARCAMRSV